MKDKGMGLGIALIILLILWARARAEPIIPEPLPEPEPEPVPPQYIPGPAGIDITSRKTGGYVVGSDVRLHATIELYNRASDARSYSLSIKVYNPNGVRVYSSGKSGTLSGGATIEHYFTFRARKVSGTWSGKLELIEVGRILTRRNISWSIP